MNQLSLETLKALIEINGDINSDYQHKDALFFRILKAAMRLVCCEMVCYITVENGVILKLVSKIKKDKETVANTDIVKSGIFDIVLRGESLYANDANEDLYYKMRELFNHPDGSLLPDYDADKPQPGLPCHRGQVPAPAPCCRHPGHHPGGRAP